MIYILSAGANFNILDASWSCYSKHKHDSNTPTITTLITRQMYGSITFSIINLIMFH